MKQKQLYILAAFVIALASCSRTAKSKKLIINNTSNQIIVSVFNKYPPEKLLASYRLYPQGIMVISNLDTKSGPLYTQQQNCVNPDDSIAFEVLDNANLKVDLNLSDYKNWTYTRTSENSKGVEDECKAVITQANIVSK